jgi:hypothetical protein
MAFTNEEKARIRLLGGWGSRWSQTETRLNSSLDAIGTTAPWDEKQIRNLLTQLDALDSLLGENRGFIGVKQTGSVVFDDTSGISGLRSEGARIVEGIYAVLECQIKHNFYRSGSPRGGQIQYG